MHDKETNKENPSDNIKKWRALMAAFLIQACIGVMFAFPGIYDTASSNVSHGISYTIWNMFTSFGALFAVTLFFISAPWHLEPEKEKESTPTGFRSVLSNISKKGIFNAFHYLVKYNSGIKNGPSILGLTGSVLVLTAFIAGVLWPGSSHGKGYFFFFCYIRGLGAGLLYVATLSVVVKWFSKNTGFAAGIIISGFYAGNSLLPLYFYTVNEQRVRELRSILDLTFLNISQASSSILVIGFLLSLVMFLGSLLLVNPEPHSQNSPDEPGTTNPWSNPNSSTNLTAYEMVRTDQFWLLALVIYFLTIAASFCTSSLAVVYGPSADNSLIRISNLISMYIFFPGCILWGVLSDRSNSGKLLFFACLVCGILTFFTFFKPGLITALLLPLASLVRSSIVVLLISAAINMFGRRNLCNNIGSVYLAYEIGFLSYILLRFSTIHNPKGDSGYSAIFSLVMLATAFAAAYVTFRITPPKTMESAWKFKSMEP
jgi:MFS family permease